MTPNDYQSAAMRTAPTSYTMIGQDQAKLLHATLGMQSESGEVADTLKRHIYYNQPLDMLNIKEECGDLLWYIALALTTIGCTMESCMHNNIEKLKLRYPEKFTEKDAKERKDKI